jgi:hypothetical protein
MVPIILSTAADMGVAPYPMMMAMAMAASASFMTPISHPANVMVMGPGGYRFRLSQSGGSPDAGGVCRCFTGDALLLAVHAVMMCWLLEIRRGPGDRWPFAPA